MMFAWALVLAAAVSLACSTKEQRPKKDGSNKPESAGESPSTPVQGGKGGTDASKEGSDTPGGGTENGLVPLEPTEPPLLGRPDDGQPLAPEELRQFTENYLRLLQNTRYFHFVTERLHGISEQDPQGRPPYAQWWEYVHLLKMGKAIAFAHEPQGSDNAASPTANILEGICHAAGVWKDPLVDRAIGNLIRALSAWIKAGERGLNEPPIMVRSFYPDAVGFVKDGWEVFYDYTRVHPGQQGNDDASDFVRVPNNPYWGDIYVKTKRSKDDVGSVLRAIGQLTHCEKRLSDATRKDLEEMRGLYAKLAKQVVADGYAFRTLDRNGQQVVTGEEKYLMIGNAECPGPLALRALAGLPLDTLSCGDGVHPLEFIAARNHMNRRLLESHHEAAVTLLRGLGDRQRTTELLGGLASRLDKTMAALKRGRGDTGFQENGFVAALIHAANLGVPLTSLEIRWLHGQIILALKAYVSHEPGFYDPLHPSTPDGKWVMTPIDRSMEFSHFALLLGVCNSRYRVVSERPVLDCNVLRKAAIP